MKKETDGGQGKGFVSIKRGLDSKLGQTITTLPSDLSVHYVLCTVDRRYISHTATGKFPTTYPLQYLHTQSDLGLLPGHSPGLLSYPAARPRGVPACRGDIILLPSPAPGAPRRGAGGCGESSAYIKKQKKPTHSFVFSQLNKYMI